MLYLNRKKEYICHMDTVFDSLGDNMEALSRIQTSIEDSKIVDRIAQKYTTAMVDGMLKEFSLNSTAMASDVNVVSHMMVTITALAVIGGVLVYNRRKRI